VNWLFLKTKLALVGAALLAALAFFVRLQSLKNKSERLEILSDTLKARIHQEKIIKKKEKEITTEFRTRETDLTKELEKTDDKDFKGLDNLNRPNDW
jgi:hypothetical protein